MAHLLASLMFGMIALGAGTAIALMLAQSRASIVAALAMNGPELARQQRAPVRVMGRRAPAWPASRSGGARRAA